MPQSSFDDPFADLFDKLPDPRRRDASPGDAAAPTPGTPATPTSRRAAREAAAREGSSRDASESERVDSPAPSEAPTAGGRDDAGDVGRAPASRGEAATARTRAATEDARPAAPRESLEDLFSGKGSTDDYGSAPPPPDRRRRRLVGWIAFGVVLLLLGGVAGTGWWAWSTYEEQIREVMGWEEPADYEPGMANGEVFITIVEGDTGAPISQKLYDAGVTKTPDAFYDHLIETGQNPPFVPGVFRLQNQMTSEAALTALLDPANRMENTAQLREGLTVEQSLPILAEATGLPIEDFQAAVADPSAYGVEADSLEGWLFPATYTFNPDVTASEIVQRLVSRTTESLDTAGVPEAERQEILTIASIIQREAREEEDFYKVSRVIQNRLAPNNQETFGRLEMDSTAQYGVGEDDGTVSSTEEALTDDNPWNTYVHPGLPIGPIANPGDVAIDAAMHPADGPWMYFVTVNLDTGETVFTNTYNDHLAAVEQWRSWCADNPDQGC